MFDPSMAHINNDSETVLLNVNTTITPTTPAAFQPPTMHFSFLDYVLFAAMLFLSTIIGVYYGFLAKTKQNTVKEYLLGGKQMHIVPISLSLIAS